MILSIGVGVIVVAVIIVVFGTLAKSPGEAAEQRLEQLTGGGPRGARRARTTSPKASC